MAKQTIVLPQMGESVAEATLIKWHKKIGDYIELEETIAEVATDKIDTEIVSNYSGKITDFFFKEGDIIKVNEPICAIESNSISEEPIHQEEILENNINLIHNNESKNKELNAIEIPKNDITNEKKIYSPLVKSIILEENITDQELENVKGTSLNGKINKEDILLFLNQRNKKTDATQNKIISLESDEIIEMDRMRKLIAQHMVMSKQVAPHVTSFIEVDVTNLVNWRNKYKDHFKKQHGFSITFMPLITEIVAKVIQEMPKINVSVDGTNIIQRKQINIGMATALPSGNLIVPVVKQAHLKNLVELSQVLNDLANRARKGQLKPEEIQGGTFTITNIGSFGNIMGTPIINQPQVAILAVGAIQKKPAVLETIHGDVIAIRQMMHLSLSYDHRVVDGSLGGSFIQKIAQYLSDFDVNKTI